MRCIVCNFTILTYRIQEMENVLVIGNGGREHAICWKLSQAPEVISNLSP